MRKQLIILAALLLSMAGMAQTVNSTDGNFTSTLADGTLNLRTTTRGVATTRLTILGAPVATAGFVGIGLGAGSPVDLLHIGGTARANQLNLVNGVLNTTSGSTNMSFNINGTTRMLLQATTGALGIGITPVAGELLHVNGSTRATQFNTTNGTINTIGAANLSFRTNNTARMTILGLNGYVGIANNNPANQLQIGPNPNGWGGNDLVVGNSSGALAIFTDATGTYLGGTSDISIRPGNGSSSIYAKSNGNVGIGTTSPANKLQIGSNPIGWVGNDFVAANGSGGLAIYTSATDTYLWGSADISIRPGNTGIPSIYAKSDGTVGIGTMLTSNPNSYKLAVNGKIGAKDVQVEVVSTTWPDYVFDNNYNLPSLTEVAQYIHQNKHLIDVPSAEQVEKEGHSLGEMDKILLKKIEELTLYVIQQQKEIEELRKKVEGKK